MFIARGRRPGIRTVTQGTRRMGEVAGLAVAAFAFTALPAVAAGKSAAAADPAHEIANRFAGDDKPAATKRSPAAQTAESETSGAQTSVKPKSPARPPVSQTAPARLDPAERAPTVPPAPETAAPAAPAKPGNDADRQTRDAELQKAYEEEMLARARAEAEAQARAELQREEHTARERAAAQVSASENAAKAEQARRALEEEKARIAREDELQRQRSAERKATEEKAAQRERESRRLTERLRAARQAREEERVRRKAEAVEAELRLAEQARRTRQAMRKRADHLAMRLEANRRARLAAARQQAAFDPATYTGATSPIATGSTHEAAPAPMPASSTRATILLVMTPGSRGIRRWNKNADPMLCVEENCYISRGEVKPADRVSRNKGFGPGIALGKRAGACSNRLACVFRDVDLGGTRAWMQPVDLRILRHDRRESRMVAADPTCTINRGRLDCRQTVESNDYRAWIVPEAMAREAGPSVLHDAVSSGLGVSHTAVMRRD